MTELAKLGLTEIEFEETRSYREQNDALPQGAASEEAGVPTGLSAAELAGWSDDAVRRLVSALAYQRTVDWETGGRQYYEKKLTCPTWPGAASGVTIGFGFDLGYHTTQEIEAAWGDQLPRTVVSRLLRATEAKKAAAQLLIPELKDIRIPWSVAEAVFVRATFPKYARQVLRHVANAAELHPHAFGALFSLTFNRGASFQKSGDRYSEMRAIAFATADRKVEVIPDQITAMKRLWSSGLRGLLLRRDGEADLFRKGIEELRKVAQVAAAPVVAGSSASLAGEGEEDFPIDDAEPEAAFPLPENYRGKVWQQGDVKWAARDDDSPDYRHLRDRSLAGRPFSIVAEDVELLIRANRYTPIKDNKRILFGLRGARLVGDRMQVDVSRLELIDTRPNHRDYRCIIGVLNLESRTLSGFAASTVPNAAAVLRCWQRHVAGIEPFHGNMLTTGCYPYVIGTHGKKQVPGCLLQGTSAKHEDRASVIVLRSLKDVSYDIDDFLHRCTPHDNLHPGFLANGFSSEGCQTIRGQFVNGAHTGDFAAFKQALGKPGTSGGGARFDYALFTGLEAAIAANLRGRGLATDPVIVQEELGRLRQGSTGVEVAALQRFLGRPQTGMLDARDREALIEAQAEARLPTDGILSPEADRRLAVNAFVPAQSATIVVAAAPSGQAAAIENAAVPMPTVVDAGRMAALLESGSESLLYQIGRRASIEADRAARPGQFRSASHEAAIPEFGFSDFVGFGTRMYTSVENEMARILCGSRDDDRQIRNAVGTLIKTSVTSKPYVSTGSSSAAGLTGEAPAAGESRSDPDLGVLVATILVQRLGILPVIAQPLAALLVNRVFKATLEDTCRRWSDVAAAQSAAISGPSARAESAGGTEPAAITPELISMSLDKSEDELFAEIASYSEQASGATQPSGAAPEAFGIPKAFTSLGREIFLRLETQLHAVVCGKEADDDGVREQIAGLIGLDPANVNRSAAVATLAAALVAQLAILPVVAVPVATVLLTKYLDRGFERGCELWGASITSGRHRGDERPSSALVSISGAVTAAGVEEAMMIGGKLMPAAYMLFASDMLPVAEIRKAKEKHLHVMVGFDSGNIPRKGQIEEKAFKLAKDLGAELEIYVEGPGGPTGSKWLPDERARIIAAARSVGIDTARRGWEMGPWQTHGWKTFTFAQLADYRIQGFHAVEIDNLGWVMKSPDELLEFYRDYGQRHAAGTLPQLVMKNLDPSYLEAVARAVETGAIPRQMFSEFHICETSCNYDTRKIGIISKRIKVRTILSPNTHKYDARGVYGYEDEFDTAYGVPPPPSVLTSEPTTV